MGEHTAGPWAIESLRYDGARIVAGRAFDKGAKPVAWVAADETIESGGHIRELMSDEANANARLVAAAPELLDALSKLADRVDPGNKSRDFGIKSLVDALGVARAAIAKAQQ